MSVTFGSKDDTGLWARPDDDAAQDVYVATPPGMDTEQLTRALMECGASLARGDIPETARRMIALKRISPNIRQHRDPWFVTVQDAVSQNVKQRRALYMAMRAIRMNLPADDPLHLTGTWNRSPGTRGDAGPRRDRTEQEAGEDHDAAPEEAGRQLLDVVDDAIVALVADADLDILDDLAERLGVAVLGVDARRSALREIEAQSQEADAAAEEQRQAEAERAAVLAEAARRARDGEAQQQEQGRDAAAMEAAARAASES